MTRVKSHLKQINNTFFIFLFLLITANTIYCQNYSVYKSKIDTAFVSTRLGYEKKISVLLPNDWQKNNPKQYPLIIIFDQQNKRSHNQIINTIDYLTASEQMPRAIIISIESDNSRRISEAKSPKSSTSGKAHLNEKFLFEEVIALAESKYKANSFRLLIGHSWYGHFTTAMFTKYSDSLSAVIALDPFFNQKNVSLMDSISALKTHNIIHTKYYRYAIGKDYPEDYASIKTAEKQFKNSKIDIKGTYFPRAFHHAVPGLGIAEALYDIFEYWSIEQFAFFEPLNSSIDVFFQSKQNVKNHYGTNLDFSLGILNGKGWFFYNNNDYKNAIEAWELLLLSYPNFSEGYLYIMDAQMVLNQDITDTIERFNASLANSQFYSEKEKNDLIKELESLKK
ncbi:alpha/beta hydrolase-fold protein [Winogradskyella algicola]|uniref:alpha/beta hydrolase-fold protein n=1 Tax=Winogradskyella algicola TaxID=2575815 RepID=UPI001109AE45|nr:alpha/beta hydrolase-fold protein [Winogradskyella algicola]